MGRLNRLRRLMNLRTQILRAYSSTWVLSKPAIIDWLAVLGWEFRSARRAFEVARHMRTRPTMTTTGTECQLTNPKACPPKVNGFAISDINR